LRALPPAVACLLLLVAIAVAAPAEPAHRGAVRIAKLGPRPAASRAEGRAHTVVKRAFRRAGLRVAVQRFRVPGHGRSRNVIGSFRTPRSCLRIVMAHIDTGPLGPGANDNASGVGVVMALAPRLRRIRPACDVWLVATGAEERGYTRARDHLGALALARRVRARRLRRRLRWALSLDEVGRGRGFWLRSPVPHPRRGVEGELLRAARRVGASVRWVRDAGSGNSDHREFQLLGLPAAKLGVGVGGEPCRERACDRLSRLSGDALRWARLAVERALRIRP
jgi:aminopeptidase YwaD